MSHPTWVRGLKLFVALYPYTCLHTSHPTWVRGLKLHSLYSLRKLFPSHPTWVRGLKHVNINTTDLTYRRTLRGCVD